MALMTSPDVGFDFLTPPAGAPAAAGMTGMQALSYLGPIMGIFGAIQGGFGAYFQAKSQKSNLEFQADMAAINARMAERSAQSILEAGQKEAGVVSMRAGKVMGAQKVSQAARGVQMGVGSAAEEIATTQLMKEQDMLTINANATRQAWAARMQSTNMQNESLLKGTTADSISPFASASASLLASGAAVASSWYKYNKLNDLASVLGV